MKEILSRLTELIKKLISIKGLIFIICTVFLSIGKINALTWAIFATILAGVRSVEKAIRAWIQINGEEK